jgi:hypothetical protein
LIRQVNEALEVIQKAHDDLFEALNSRKNGTWTTRFFPHEYDELVYRLKTLQKADYHDVLLTVRLETARSQFVSAAEALKRVMKITDEMDAETGARGNAMAGVERVALRMTPAIEAFNEALQRLKDERVNLGEELTHAAKRANAAPIAEALAR